MADLLTKLDDYGYSDNYAFNMPGHKRNYDLTDFFEYYYKHDVKELDDFDDIQKPEGILLDCMTDAARLFGADETFFLVNGAECGIMAAVSSLVSRGGKMLVSRFSNRAVYNIAFMRNISLSYILPRTDAELGVELAIKLDDIKECVEKEKYSAVYITTPNICGYTADLEAICEYLHEKGIPLIVDASYGAHFGFSDFFPKSACEAGADIVVSAICNTLPSPRQTGLLHINGSKADREKVSYYLNMYQSAEPSYVLMAGLDDCITYLETGNAEDKWIKFREMRDNLHDALRDLKYVGIRDCYSDNDIEPGKMLIYSKSSFINGKMLYERLVTKHHIQPEFAMPNYVLLTFTMFDTEDGFNKLKDALYTIDEKLKRKEEGLEDTISLGSLAQLFNVTEKSDGGQVLAPTRYPAFPNSKKAMEIGDTEESELKVVNLIDAEGEISHVFVEIKANNQIILVPGEEISKDVVFLISHYRRHGFEISGLNGDYIEVIRKRQI